MDEKEVLIGFVGKALNLPNDEIASLVYGEDGTIKPDAVETLASRDAARIQALRDAHKTELTTVHDKGYKKAQAESLAKFETELKEEYGVQADLKGKDLVKEIVAKIAKDPTLDEEKVKLHPKFIELERKLGNEYTPKSDYDKLKSEYDEYKKSFERRQVLQAVTQDALKVFRSLKPVLSKDPARATNQETDFLNKLNAFNFDLQNDGNHLILMEGKRLETPNGHPINFGDFIKQEAAKYFDFEVQDGRQNAGNQGGGSGGNGSANITAPKTKEEYIKAITTETDPVKRVAIQKAWDAMNK